MYVSLFYYCIHSGGSLYIFPLMYMYIFRPPVLILIQVLFIKWYTEPDFRVRVVPSLE
jgi:hypothetical protein